MTQKTLFVSMIDGTNEDVNRLADVFQDIGLRNQFNIVLSATPIQTVDPATLIEQLQHIHLTSQAHPKLMNPVDSIIELIDVLTTMMVEVDNNLRNIQQNLNIVANSTNVPSNYYPTNVDYSSNLRIIRDLLLEYKGAVK